MPSPESGWIGSRETSRERWHGLAWLVALTAALSLGGCTDAPAPEAQAMRPAIDTLTVVGAGTGDGTGWDGVVEAVRSAELTAQTAGRVVEVRADINDRVDAGEILVRLSAVEQEAGANTARAQARAAEAAAAEAERQYRRFATLSEGRYVSRAQVDQARAARDTAIAARDAARAQVAQAQQQADYTIVRAPYAGVIARRLVEPGEAVAPGQPLIALHAPEAVRIEVQVPQSLADAIRARPAAELLFDDGRRVQAAGVTVFPGADPSTQTVGVRIALPPMPEGAGSPAPMPGMPVHVRFAADTGTDTGTSTGTGTGRHMGTGVANDAGAARAAVAVAVAIPDTAIARRGELTAVYVVDGDRLLLRQVRLGDRSGDRVRVIAGLRPGETIARDPAAALKVLAAQRAATGDAR